MKGGLGSHVNVGEDWGHYGNLSAVASCIHDGLHRRDTDSPLFHGSYDWHSSVHAYWAALRLSRLHDHGEHRSWLVDRLSVTLLSLEFARLSARPEFERPYGRAWLLTLCRELEEVRGQRLDAGADGLAESLLGWLSTQRLSPDTAEYSNHSWALLQLAEWFEHRDDLLRVDHIRAIVVDHFLSTRLSLSQDIERGEFFSRWSLQALLLTRLLPPSVLDEWLAFYPMKTSDFAPILEYQTVHHLGTNATRAWAFAALFERTNCELWLDAYQQHIDVCFALMETHRREYEAFAHWVPQFIVYALSLRKRAGIAFGRC